MNTEELMQLVKINRNILKETIDIEDNPIYMKLDPIRPFIGNQKIKLIIIGQDPTVKNFNSRKNINITLNLDKTHSIYRYVANNICANMGFGLQNIYATNLFKYFYVCSPSNTFHVLQQHLKPNLKLLLKEIKHLKGVPIITLGEPILKLLTSKKNKLINYWDYNKNNKSSNLDFKHCNGTETILGIDFFPFPHQPSFSQNMFYKKTLIHYIKYFKIINNF